ncbi:hypothetical protein, partial [Hydrogenivirga sp. 128-5-R1-1]|uniref:hypothetical protein n=1 Tax=Hydrogenivirga sp. 128-5-R1-1 TaxID=392423 RepID=UPI00015F3980
YRVCLHSIIITHTGVDEIKWLRKEIDDLIAGEGEDRKKKDVLRDFYNVLLFSEEDYIEDLFCILKRDDKEYDDLITFQNIDKGDIGVALFLLEKKLREADEELYNRLNGLVETVLAELRVEKDDEVYERLKFVLMRDVYEEKEQSKEELTSDRKTKERLKTKGKELLKKGRSLIFEEAVRQSVGFTLGTLFGKMF